MEANLLYLILIFFLISTVYSSAGFGGGSSYLAILSLFGIPFVDMKVLALVCNIVVVSSSVYLFNRNHLYDYKRIIPLVLMSIPFAFVGGRHLLEESFFFTILGITLFLAGLLMLNKPKNSKHLFPKNANLLMGGGIGFLSGLVGIGGGIFLSPILHLSRWDNSLRIAACAALFILANSIAGLIGLLSRQGWVADYSLLAPLMIAVLLGGQIGTRLSIFKCKALQIRRITAILVMLVALRILGVHSF